MRRVKRISLMAMIACLCGLNLSAQEKVEFTVGADVVSSYVWRGVYQLGISVQPEMSIGYKGLSLGVWGSSDFGDFKEVDFSLGYAIGGFELAVTDYFWNGVGEPYFRSYTDGHHFEGSVAYTFDPRFPLTASWSTFFAGEDKKASGHRAYSSYVELSYPFSIGPVDLAFAVGAAPWSAPLWLDTGNKCFQVSNIALTAAKAIKVTESYSLPVFAQLSVNPAGDDINFVFGISF